MCFDHVFGQQSREVSEREILEYSIKQGNVIPASLKFYALNKIEMLQHRVYHRSISKFGTASPGFALTHRIALSHDKTESFQ